MIEMLIEKLVLEYSSLRDKTIVVTGGGGGIASQACAALAYMGANVIVAEKDEQKARNAIKQLELKWHGCMTYHNLDLSNSQSISQFSESIMNQYGCPDAIVHNATIIPVGDIEKMPIDLWDESYRVNLRGPIELTKKFLPTMKERRSGTIVFTPSSGAVPYMGAYEVFKTAQTELANTLMGELEDTNIKVFCFAPGLVETCSANDAIQQIAPLMGMTIKEFYSMNENNMISPEEAGVALAVSLLFADMYGGCEIGGVQVLMDAGLMDGKDESEKEKAYSVQKMQALSKINKTFEEQYEGWKERNVFERQWTLRDFKKFVGRSADEVCGLLNAFLKAFQDNQTIEHDTLKKLLRSMEAYYKHQYTLMQSYIKDQKKKAEFAITIQGWIDDINTYFEVE